jgi:hypothetical protein
MEYITEVSLLQAHVILNTGLPEDLLTLLKCIRLLWLVFGTLVMLSGSFKEIQQLVQRS